MLVANELRSERVHATFLEAFGKDWQIKRIALNKLHPQYRHPLIHVYALRRRGRSTVRAVATDSAGSSPGLGENEHTDVAPSMETVDGPEREDVGVVDLTEQQPVARLGGDAQPDAWETRRLGAALAACLADVAVPEAHGGNE